MFICYLSTDVPCAYVTHFREKYILMQKNFSLLDHLFLTTSGDCYEAKGNDFHLIALF